MLAIEHLFTENGAMDDQKLGYENTDDNAKFREQYRFAFSVAIIATCFVIPDQNILWQYLGYVVGASALFSACYLVMSASKLKYREPGRIYEVFRISESLRMRAFDWSIHVFGAAFLFFLGILLTGLTFNLTGAEAESRVSWLIVIIYTFCLGICLILMEHILSRRKNKNSKDLPRI